MKASMDKQNQLKEEIRLLLNLTIANLKGPAMASAESKGKDEATLEAGLSYIGLTLENGERKIAELWAMYEGLLDKFPATIKYPEAYSLRSEADRRNEADQLGKLGTLIPSPTYQKQVGKKIANVLLSSSNTTETMRKIYQEIDNSPGLSSDAEIIGSDLDHGLVSNKTASILRGYAPDEADKAANDHAERLARIAAAQQPAGNPSGNMDSNGVPDLQGDPLKSKTDSKGQKDPTTKESTKPAERGKAK
jgi:hypothetical protein